MCLEKGRDPVVVVVQREELRGQSAARRRGKDARKLHSIHSTRRPSKATPYEALLPTDKPVPLVLCLDPSIYSSSSTPHRSYPGAHRTLFTQSTFVGAGPGLSRDQEGFPCPLLSSSSIKTSRPSLASPLPLVSPAASHQLPSRP